MSFEKVCQRSGRHRLSKTFTAAVKSYNGWHERWVLEARLGKRPYFGTVRDFAPFGFDHEGDYASKWRKPCKRKGVYRNRKVEKSE